MNPEAQLVNALPPDKSANGSRKSAGGGQHGNGRDFAPGHDPRRGHGPARGHGGHPTNEQKARVETLAARGVPEEILADIQPEVRQELLIKHPATYIQLMRLRFDAWRDAADRAHGRPTQSVDVSDAFDRVFEVTETLSPEEWRAKYGRRG